MAKVLMHNRSVKPVPAQESNREEGREPPFPSPAIPSPLANTEDSNRSECPHCPSWVMRCAHFNGRVVRLADSKAIRVGPFHVLPDTQFLVANRKDSLPHPCSCCGAPVFGDAVPMFSAAAKRWSDGAHDYEGNDYDAALAAYHVAEERLLQAVQS